MGPGHGPCLAGGLYGVIILFQGFRNRGPWSGAIASTLDYLGPKGL